MPGALQRRARGPLSRARVFSVPEVIAEAPKVMWAIDVQLDSTVDGKAVKIASTVHECTDESLLHLLERSVTDEHLVVELENVFATVGGSPMVQRMDHGAELVLLRCNSLRRRDGLSEACRQARRATTASSNHSTTANDGSASSATAKTLTLIANLSVV